MQAIGLLDDLDKELNTYAMRVREWYGWHFPEMTKIVTGMFRPGLVCVWAAVGHCLLGLEGSIGKRGGGGLAKSVG